MSWILPVILALLGTAAGVGGGYIVKQLSIPSETVQPCGDPPETDQKPGQDDTEHTDTHEYVKMNNQFVVPIVTGKRVSSLVVLSISLEVGAGQREGVYEREPKIRDAFLQVLFDHANLGAFEGDFTRASNMDILRERLFNTGRMILGDAIKSVLITDVARQDV
jgi:flagellar basal body-associated protein FliL